MARTTTTKACAHAIYTLRCLHFVNDDLSRRYDTFCDIERVIQCNGRVVACNSHKSRDRQRMPIDEYSPAVPTSALASEAKTWLSEGGSLLVRMDIPVLGNESGTKVSRSRNRPAEAAGGRQRQRSSLQRQGISARMHITLSSERIDSHCRK